MSALCLALHPYEGLRKIDGYDEPNARFVAYDLIMNVMNTPSHDASSHDTPTAAVSEAVIDMAARFAALGVMPTPGQAVADIGEDSGLVGFALIRHVADASCITIRPAAELDNARELAAQIGVQNRVTFRRLDTAALDFEADSLDVVLFDEGIQLRDDAQLAAVLESLRLAIRPGGVVYVSSPSRVDEDLVSLRSLLAAAGFDDMSQAPSGSFVLRRFALSSV